MTSLIRITALSHMQAGIHDVIEGNLKKNDAEIAQLPKGLIIKLDNTLWKVYAYSTNQFTAIIAFNQTCFEGYIIGSVAKNKKDTCTSYSLENGASKNRRVKDFVLSILKSGSISKSENVADLDKKTKELALKWMKKHNILVESFFSETAKQMPNATVVPTTEVTEQVSKTAQPLTETAEQTPNVEPTPEVPVVNSSSSTKKSYINIFLSVIGSVAFLTGIYAAYRFAQGRFFNPPAGKQ